ncbi:MAG: ChbG/HpnK family deacetylase [Candidatus Omnitrophica bacterium]|nr:ChbG/HpnK family deacetylase [Candidatus Omnitrophota bacterium]
MQKKLIINIDDVGLSRAVNEAVKECHVRGVSVETSLMSVGEAFEEACSMFKDLGRESTGVHLTLTGNFLPCASRKNVGSLIRENGQFYKDYFKLLSMLLGGKLKSKEIELEFEEQIKKIKDNGFEITHLDSHEHIHMMPAIFHITVNLAKKYNIPYIRIPKERTSSMMKSFKMKDVVRQFVLKAAVFGKKRTVFKNGLMCNDEFLGHFHSGRMNDDVLCSLLPGVKEGVTELGVHVAVHDPGFLNKFPWYKNGQIELNMLLNGKWRKRIKTLNIEVVTHREISS